MPLGLDPNETEIVSLKSDVVRHPDVATRPGFRFKYLTGREKRQWSEAFAVAEAAENAGKDDDEVRKLVDAALAVGLRGAVNLPPEYAEAPLDALTLEEAWELAASYPSAVSLGESRRKNSGGPSSSLAAKPAGEPEAAPAPAADALPPVAP